MKVISLNNIIPFVTILNQLNFFSDNKIYSDYNMLTVEEINKLCNKINDNNNRYSILLYNNLLNPIYSLSDTIFTTQCEVFFNTYTKNKNEGIALCVFITSLNFNNAQGKIRINYGYKVHDKISINEKNTIINLMGSYLKNRFYYKAFDKAIDELNDNLYEGHSFFFKFFFYFLLPLFIIGGLYYYFVYNKKEENNNLINNNNTGTPQYEILIDNDNNDNNNNINNNYNKSINNMYIPMQDYPTYDEILSNDQQVYNHIKFLENILIQLKHENPQIISIDKCLICLNQIIILNNNNNLNINKRQIEMSNFGTPFGNDNNNNSFFDKINVRFACGHIFHSECLRKYNLGKCLICINLNDGKCSEVIENKFNTQIIDENKIKNLIINFTKIYNNNDLRNFSVNFRITL